ncbi:uncharacterized protein LOC119111985 isoform X3 [Pollicipes pollicipes]|uniref:uncharacterized protein LOC119111985 isoform X3 n=1 Tax=Pollicipes pollicipes TaxID=41117 RepID=UPI001884D747|nr:uncharacterized protein LOC119111985 isoform X3 [Pollicipes pollicipes]
MRTASLPNLSRETEELRLPNGVVIVFSHLLASNKADYGLEDLQNLNVKDRFSVFERTNEDDQEKGLASVEVKRSQSILNKMKRFQERDSARDADSASGDESADSGDEQRRDPDLVRSTSKTRRERPISFSGLGDVKSRFEGGRREPTPDDKGEQTKLRGMICGAREHKLAYEEALREQEAQAESRRSLEDPSLVVQVGNLRASYERAVQESGSPRPAAARDHEAVTRRRAADMASRFERGDVASAETDADADAPAVNENGGSHNGHSLSHDQSSAAGESALASLSSDAGGSELARGDSPDGQAVMEAPVADPELLHSDTTKRMLSKFKQMEQSTGNTDEELSLNREKAHGNARQILSKFRQMEEDAHKEDLPDGPRPLKSFTPPPEEPAEPEDAAEDSEEEPEDPDIIRASHKVPDEFLNKRTDQARSLRDKFESWGPPAGRDDKFTVEDDCRPSLEITRSLRAKFESLNEPQKPAEKTQHRASRFIMEPNQAAEMCDACNKRVYAMERLEVDKRILHKNCFRCSKCNCVLRMDTYTFNAGKLFCTPHFKQMFKTKGNYDEGFGLESRTKHWSSSHTDHSASNGTNGAAPRPGNTPAETNGGSPEPRDADDNLEPLEQEEEEERERERQEEEDEVILARDEAEPTADVFQKVYESTVAENM